MSEGEQPMTANTSTKQPIEKSHLPRRAHAACGLESLRFRVVRVVLGLAVVLTAGLTACASTRDAKVELSELDVVDCIVEGAVRQVGRGFAYQEPPRMARLTEDACAALGGTFTIYDPARPEEVISKWLPFAEGGDAIAQHRLGMIYEGVLGAEPDYAKAAQWYQKAVDQGHRESMYALSVLYEQGLGVKKDVVKALNLYRQASGIEADSLMLSSDAMAEIDKAKRALGAEIAELKAQRNALSTQVAQLERGAGSNAGQVAALQKLVKGLEGQLAEKQEALVAMPTFRLIDPKAGQRATRTEFDFPPLPAKMMRTRAVGKFYALVIGNNDYERMPDLKTPHNDARAIAKILTDRYGFSTQLMLDANEEEIKRAIHKLVTVAEEKDNLLIYFAGHGHMRTPSERARLRGFWLPTNADQDQDVNWVDNWWVTNHLDTAKARRALVIADSCYGGVFSTDLPIGPVTQLPALQEADFNKKLERRSRFVLASGGDTPILDATGPDAEHSIFAQAFIDVLEEGTGPMSVVEVYGRVFDRMYTALADSGIEQEPELRVIRAAGHQSEGDFFFVAN